MDERKLEKASVSLARDEQVSVAELEAKANAEARDEQASVAELEARRVGPQAVDDGLLRLGNKFRETLDNGPRHEVMSTSGVNDPARHNAVRHDSVS